MVPNYFFQLLCYFLISLSFFSYAEEEYFVVLNQPLPSQMNPLGQALTTTTIGSNQMASEILSVFSRQGVGAIKLFSKHIKGSGSQQLMSVLSSTSEEYTYLVQLEAAEVVDFVSSVKQLESYVHVQPNYIYTTFSIGPTEPMYNDRQKTAMEMMGFSDVWSIASGDGIRVAVLDTGINVTHEEFCNGSATVNEGAQTMVLDAGCTNVVAPFDFIDDASPSILSGKVSVVGADYETIDAAPIDKDGHGTHVAGIIAAHLNSKGILGAAYSAQIIPIRVMAPYKDCSSCTVHSSGRTSHIVQGINYAVTNNADVINMSLGGILSTGEDLLMRQAIDNATAMGVLVVAAAGNSRINIDENRVAPAYFPNVLSVSSTTKTGAELSYFSNFGQSLDVAAFGGQSTQTGAPQCIGDDSVFSAGIDSPIHYVSLCGTSMAAPYVSGLAAIIKGYYKDVENQTITPAEIRRLIQISATLEKGETSLTFGHGVINARQALFLSGASLADENSSDIYVGANGNGSDLICYPNPLNLSQVSKTVCTYFLNQAATIQWWIISRRGEIVQSESKTVTIGEKMIAWDGRDRSMSFVPNGVYQLVLKVTPDSDLKTITRKHLITLFR